MGISDDEVILGVFQCTKSYFYEVQIIRGEYFCTKSGSCDVQIKGGQCCKSSIYKFISVMLTAEFNFNRHSKGRPDYMFDLYTCPV